MLEKSVILENYLRIALNNIGRCIYKRDHFNFKCNVCGDGQKKSNKRGHLLRSRSTDNYELFWAFKCFNDGCPASGEGRAWSGDKWLKYTSPELYNKYVREILTPTDPKEIEKQKEEWIKKQKEEKKKELQEKTKKENEAVKYFIKLNNEKDEHKKLINDAIMFCIKRKIPKHIWENWFVSYHGLYRNRLIIPFYDKNNHIYYYQARALFNYQNPKYLNRLKNKDKSLYNIHHIDKTKPVILLEGVIDSLFVENSVAILGLSHSKYSEKLLEGCDVYYLLDNDNAGKINSKELLKKGHKVFLWNDFKYNDCKDINEIVIKHNIKKFTFNDLKKHFTNNVYDELYLEV